MGGRGFGAEVRAAGGDGDACAEGGGCPGRIVDAVPAAVVTLSYEPIAWIAHGVLGVLWVAAGSQFLGPVVWYRGMAAVGIPKASRLQLAQPLLTLVWSVLLLGEHLTAAAPLTAAAVLACIAGTQRSRS